MCKSLVFASVCAGAVGLSAVAGADDAAPPPQRALSKVRVFEISPDQSDQDFLCESGSVQSVLATAVAEHRVVSITLIDDAKRPIREDVWTVASGFRLAHKQNVKVKVVMICGG